MLRKSARLRKEFLHRKTLEVREADVKDRKRRLRDALESGGKLPTEMQADHTALDTLTLEDDATLAGNPNDDEYAMAGSRQPAVLVTTSRAPSSRLAAFAKELKLLLPGGQRLNRGGLVLRDLVEMGKRQDLTDVVIVHETRGQPTGLVVSHLPLGPTAHFALSDVVLRHDLPKKPPPMSEAYPHLIFHNFSSSLGKRAQKILGHLFPPPSGGSARTMSFVNRGDFIHFRHHVWTEEKYSEEEQTAVDKKRKVSLFENPHRVSLREVGPRFCLRLYRIDLGTVDMTGVETEWALRSFINRPRAALAAPINDACDDADAAKGSHAL
eukprot:Polyplicarium_translucidae@DN4074_c0_g1_i1.p1